MTPNPKPNGGVPPIAQTAPVAIAESPSEIETRLMNNTWISPAQVDVGNFYPSARAEWNIRIHNGNEETTQIEKKLVTTSLNEIVGTIQLKYPLADGDTNKASITSDNSMDKLVITRYIVKTKELVIEGFAPNSSRTITIVYKAWKEF